MTTVEKIEFDILLVACGPWTSLTCKSLSLSLRPALFGQKAHSLLIEPCSVSPTMSQKVVDNNNTCVDNTCLFVKWEHDSLKKEDIGELELYPRMDGVYVCGCGEHSCSEEDIDCPSNVTCNQKSIEILRKASELVSPSYLNRTQAKLLRGTACYLPVSSTGMIVAGELFGKTKTEITDGGNSVDEKKAKRQCCQKMNNKMCAKFYVAAGHSCWGILNGPATGQGMAEMMLNVKNGTARKLLEPFNPSFCR
eukprot:g2038.t1